MYVVNNLSNTQLYRNNGNGNSWLHVEFEGTVSNRNGFGAVVTAVAGGLTLRRDVHSGSSKLSQPSLPVEFGFGGATVVDELTVEWPSGIVQTLNNVATNQVLPLTEPFLIDIDPVGYVGNYDVGQGWVSGPTTLTAVPGIYSLHNGADAFQFEVDVLGQVTSLNPDAATSLGSALTLHNVSFDVDPVNYTGSYQAVSGTPYLSGAQSFIVIPTIAEHIANGTRSFSYEVDSAGDITIDNPLAATVNGNTIIFNNVSFDVDPVAYAGVYQAIAGGSYVTGPQYFITIPALASQIGNGTSM